MLMIGKKMSHNAGFSLLELMIAAAILIILFMAFLSSMTGAFLADNMAVTGNACRVTSERIMEETLGLAYADTVMVDQNAVLAADGIAGKLAVQQVTTNLLLVEVYVFKPVQQTTAANLAAMSTAAVKSLKATPGSRVRLLCLKANH